MAGHTTPYPPDWKQQRRFLREQARLQRDAMRARSRMQREQMRALRGGTILGPLVLIAVGLVFLLVETGRLRGSLVWAWYGRWWPLLLVAAGVLVLAEWTFDRFVSSGDRPTVRRGLGFGLWFIFFVVVLTGLVAAHVGNLGILSSRLHIGPNDETIAELVGNLHEMDQSFNQPLSANASLLVDSPRGGVSISGTSTDGQMHIQLRREIYTNSDDDAQQKAQQLTPRFDTAGSQVSISLPFVEGTETGMTITVPPATPISVNTAHGDIDVSGIRGRLMLTSNHGHIAASNIVGAVNGHIITSDSSFSAHNIDGSIILDTMGQDITISDVTGSATVRSSATGSAHLERINGSASYHSDRTQFNATRLDGQFDTNGKYLTIERAFGPINLNTYSYDITLDRITGDAIVRNRNGSIDLIGAPPLGNLNITNGGGLINVTVPDRANFTVEADSNRGQIFSEFPALQETPQLPRNNHRFLHGNIGSGGPFLRITTTNGDISLRKATIQPLPATPPPAAASADFAPFPGFDSHPLTPSEARARAVEDRTRAREEVRQAILNTKQTIRQSTEDLRQATRDVQQAGR